MFKDYKVLVENKTGKQIKTFRFDNGEEFTSSDFIDFCKEVGIRKGTTVPYNPKQNGVAERKNRTILEVVKAMFHDQKLLKFLWGDVANTIVYVQNKSPRRTLNNKTQVVVFTSESPWILWILLHVTLLKGDLYGFVTLFKMLINMLPLEELSDKTRNIVDSKDML